MEPVSSLVTGHVAGKLIDLVTSTFKTQVIERWSKHRAQKFFEEFCREVELELAGAQSAKLDFLLTQILADETCSEVLFDAYRRVSLTRSKTLGPKIIGIVTAQLVLEKRTANEVDDRILSAAENLTDDELLAFREFVQDYLRRAAIEKEDTSFDKNGGLAISWCEEKIDSNWDRGTNMSIAPLDLDKYLGPWASKLKSYGVLSDDVKERHWEYREDSERYIDQDGTVREISWWIYIPKDYFRLAELVTRAAEKKEAAVQASNR